MLLKKISPVSDDTQFFYVHAPKKGPSAYLTYPIFCYEWLKAINRLDYLQQEIYGLWIMKGDFLLPTTEKEWGLDVAPWMFQFTLESGDIPYIAHLSSFFESYIRAEPHSVTSRLEKLVTVYAVVIPKDLLIRLVQYIVLHEKERLDKVKLLVSSTLHPYCKGVINDEVY